jgi:hypothetical protein
VPSRSAGGKPQQPAELFYFPWLSPPGQVLHNPRAGSPATRARGHNRGEFVFGGNICGSQPASWNQIARWLNQIDDLRQAA